MLRNENPTIFMEGGEMRGGGGGEETTHRGFCCWWSFTSCTTTDDSVSHSVCQPHDQMLPTLTSADRIKPEDTDGAPVTMLFLKSLLLLPLLGFWRVNAGGCGDLQAEINGRCCDMCPPGNAPNRTATELSDS